MRGEVSAVKASKLAEEPELAVSNNGYHTCKRDGKADRCRLADVQMLALIRTIHDEFKGACGRLRMVLQLRARDFSASVARVERLTCSMSRKGNCWDNAPTASWFNSFKNERVHGWCFATRKQMTVTAFEYLEVFYKRTRLTRRQVISRRPDS